MLRIAFCIRKGSLLAKAMVMLYLTAFLAGGFWEAVSENGITLPAFLILLLPPIWASGRWSARQILPEV